MKMFERLFYFFVEHLMNWLLETFHDMGWNDEKKFSFPYINENNERRYFHF